MEELKLPSVKEIQEMEAGPIMDALIAKFVFGLNVVDMNYPFEHDCDSGRYFPASFPAAGYFNEETIRRPVYAGEHAIWPPQEQDDDETMYMSFGNLYAHVSAVSQYSTDIAAAWEAFENLGPGWWIGKTGIGINNWQVFSWDSGKIGMTSHANTPILAICRTVLLNEFYRMGLQFGG